jgi:hypothetical protein
MYPQQEYVREMMLVFGQTVRDFPNMIQDPKERLLTGNLIAEETFETLKGLGFSVTVVDGKPVLVDDQTPNLVAAADGLGDLQVVLDGAANRLGLDMQKIFTAVHASNMSKVGPDGKVNRRESDGKVIKPDTYKPVELESLLLVLREEALEGIVARNYKALHSRVAQGQELYSVLAADLAEEPTITSAVIQRMVDTNQINTRPYMLRRLTKHLLFLGVHNVVNVAQVADKTGFLYSFVREFAAKAMIKYPLLFSDQIVEPEDLPGERDISNVEIQTIESGDPLPPVKSKGRGKSGPVTTGRFSGNENNESGPPKSDQFPSTIEPPAGDDQSNDNS